MFQLGSSKTNPDLFFTVYSSNLQNEIRGFSMSSAMVACLTTTDLSLRQVVIWGIRGSTCEAYLHSHIG